MSFEDECKQEIKEIGKSKKLKDLSLDWMCSTAHHKYTYHFRWMGRPIIQYPQDIIALQEIIWDVKPDLIVETGIAHGGSLIFSASMLELLGNDGRVLGIDIDIREHNRKAIEAHPMFKRISMIQGSSISKEVVEKVFEMAGKYKNPLVILDSNHTHEHVAKELEMYSPLVKKGSYLIVFDTVVEDMSGDFFQDRPWGKGDNPKTAVWEFLKKNDRFRIDHEIENKLLITVAPDGYLRCVRD